MVQTHIGFSGVTSRNDAEEVLKVFPPNSACRPMIGIFLDNEVLAGNNPVGRYPTIRKIKDILSIERSDLLTVLHCCREEADRFPGFKLLNAAATIKTHFPHVNLALELGNNCLPMVHDLIEVRNQFHDTKIILTIDRNALAAMFHDPRMVLHAVLPYCGIIDFLFINFGDYAGFPLEVDFIANLMNGIFGELLINHNVGIIVSGGFNSTNLHILEPLKDKVPGLSLITTSGIRNQWDQLELDRAQQYVRAALDFFGCGTLCGVN